MKDIYDINFSEDTLSKTKMRLTNQLWKLIPMREKEEDWQKQLNTVIIEIAGIGKVFCDCPQILQVFSKLEGLKNTDIVFEDYRKTIFECINNLQQVLRNEK